MEYRKLGRNGLKISALSFGSWMTFGSQLDIRKAADCMAVAFDSGVNFFDNAEVYAGGRSEEVMGEVFKKTNWPRLSYCISTKFFWGIVSGPNSRNTLNRKYLMQAIDGSLKRLQMEFVDLVYCHRPDPETPMEEVVWAMNDMIASGKALYWGTSEWSAAEIEAAFAVCERLNLRKPVVEQPQYNLVHRERVEKELPPVFDRYGMGLTTWSPLASGVLSGKYANGIPQGSRLSQESMAWLREEALSHKRQVQLQSLNAFAKDLNCTAAQLAIAWCLRNKNVSSVITGASSPEQVKENMRAFNVYQTVDAPLWSQIEKIFA